MKVQVRSVLVYLPDRYEELAKDTPGLEGKTLKLEILVDTGEILGWPKEQNWNLDIGLKVVDTGVYKLLDPEGNIVGEINQDYVPNDLIPGEYGDYVDLQIDNMGFITNWPKRPCFSAFFKEEG